MKILATDFDNTIYYEDERNIKNKDNVESLNKFVNEGNILIIVTGRNFTDVKKLINELGLKYTYLISIDGAKIFNNVDYCINTIYLKQDEVKEIIKVLENINCNYYLDDGYNHTKNINDTVKVVVKEEDDSKKEFIVNEIKKVLDIHVYKSRRHVNIIDKSVNKKEGLLKLFELEHLDLNNLTCIGDNDNDYEMLEYFNSVVIKEHHKVLNKLNLKEYETIKDYIEEIK